MDIPIAIKKMGAFTSLLSFVGLRELFGVAG